MRRRLGHSLGGRFNREACRFIIGSQDPDALAQALSADPVHP